MSEIERKKGKLIPVSFEAIVEEYPNASIDDLRWDTDGNYVRLGGKFYMLELEDVDVYDYFCEVSEDDWGIIHFHTMYHNGGTCWEEMVEEMVEGALK